ncbi:MAG: DUF58 domain-containing protein [Clostridiales bacterium]|nr:DUF58 domain-containing protein [Clostridiales bacterium]
MAVFWIIVTVSIIALLQVNYYNRRGLSKVEYERRFNKDEVFVGDKLELIEVLSNNKLIPVPWVRVESRMSASLKFKKQENLDINMEQFHKSVFFLGGNSRITRRHEIQCLKRGYFDCSRVFVVAGDIFGLGSDSRDVVCNARLTVFPEILKPSRLPDTALKWQGDVAVRRWILPDPVLVSGIREYRSGDSQKDVHWGATARTGVLQVKTRDFTVSPRVMLVFNSQISDNLVGAMEPRDTDFLETGVNICASLAAWCVSNAFDVGFASNGAAKEGENGLPYLEPRCSHEHLRQLLRLLAMLVIKMQVGFHALLDNLIDDGITETDILIVSAYWSDAIEKRVQQLRKNKNTVTYIPIEGGGQD